MSYFVLMGRRIPKQAITGFKFQNETDNIRPFLSIRIRGKEEIIPFKDKKEIQSVKAHLCSVFSGFVKIGDWYLKMSEVKEYKPVTAEDMNPYILFKTSKFGNIKVRFLKDEDKEVVYPRTGVPVFMLKDIGIGFRTIEGATEVANLLIKYNAFKMESKFLIGSYEQFWIINGSVCPAITGEAGYSKEEFDKVNKENKDPELKSINSFNDTVKKANEIKDRVLKYVYNIKQERSYNNDLIGIFERYKDIADGDMEVAMNFIKEAYPFNEETESFIRKKFDMPIPDESKEP